MKKTAFFLGLGIAILASVQFAGAAQIINDTLQVNSLKVGQQGAGGVTYFNGTIVNETTDDAGGDNPVTFGDNVRIDGRVYRGATAGTADSLKFIVNDNMEVVGSLTIGSTDVGAQLTSLSSTDTSLQSQITTLGGTDTSLQTQINAKGIGDMLKSTYDVAGNGAIDADKLDSGIAATLLGSGLVSNTEFGYLNGVTSAIQTQLNAKGVGDMLKSTYDVAGNGAIDAGKLDSGISAALISGGSVSSTIFDYVQYLNLSNVSDIHLTALGIDAGGANTSTGLDNTFIGYQAGDANTVGDSNVAVGMDALGANTNSPDNVAIGRGAMLVHNLETWGRNVAIGAYALMDHTTGTQNTGIGYGALSQMESNSNSTAVGYGALNKNYSAEATAVGSFALTANTTGLRNTAVGYDALGDNTQSSDNVAIGHSAAALNISTGNQNTVVGNYAMDANTNGNYNVALGYNALGNGNNADSNTAVGLWALLSTTGDFNIGIGNKAGDNITSGDKNIIIGDLVDAPSATGDNQLNIGNVILGSVDSTAPRVDIDAAFAFTPSADQARLDDSTITIDNGIVRVAGSGGAALLDTDPAIEDGAADGQIVIIQGTSDTNTVQIVDAVNTALVGDTAITLGQGDNIQLMWDSGDSIWYEISRANN